MKTRIEELKEKLKIEKEKIAALEAEIQMLQQQSKYPKSKLMELWACDSKILTINGQYFDKKYVIFAALVETCREWNRIDKFEPHYDGIRVIIKNLNDTVVISSGLLNRALMFKDLQTASLFLNTYKTELEQVKDLI